jgi:hypothetical protein
MLRFEAVIDRFGQKGEKTGWTYIEIPNELSEKLNPGVRKSYRVKGKVDHVPFEKISLTPMGEGNFILALKAELRKKLAKPVGEKVSVQMSLDHSTFEMPPALRICFDDEPDAAAIFKKMPPSHHHYYYNWINAAKTEATQAKRIAAMINALLKGQDFGQMLRAQKENRAH